ncbi:unnamed protein product [Cuscuta campestris]|uniref:Uncharacterized protein n=1 Tax=Cuscuta campestris TaxID=132261 RepID=A0A484NIJ9_9ASTE|nr:unnamed protein product [Cuscuta campestris]
MQNDASTYGVDQPDLIKVKHGDHVLSARVQEPSRTPSSQSPDSRLLSLDSDRFATAEASGSLKLPDVASKDPASRDRENGDRFKSDVSQAEIELRQQRGATANRISTDRPPKFSEGTPNGVFTHNSCSAR